MYSAMAVNRAVSPPVGAPDPHADVDPVARFVQYPSPLKVDVSQMRRDQPVILGGKRGE